MTELLGILVVALVPYFAFARSGWRGIFLLIIPAGFTQEPIRKSIDGQPVTIQLIAVVIFALAFLAAALRFGGPTFKPMAGDNHATRKILILFTAFIVMQSLHSYVRFGTIMVPLLGLLSYLLPFPVLWTAYRYVRRPDDIRRFLALYVAVSFLMTLGVIANYHGVDSPLFKQVGDAPMVVYHQVTGVVDLYCGYLRTPEVAAWHAAALACAAVTLAISFRGAVLKFVTPALVTYALITVVLTGRRKALAIMVAFAAIYWIGLVLAKRRGGAMMATAGIVVGALLVGAMSYMAPDSAAPSPYLERSATAFDDAADRFSQLGLKTVVRSFEIAGPLGLGTGAGAQGAQHISGVVTQGSAEGGLGRITLELGPLGLILAVIAAIAVARQTRRCVSLAEKHSIVLLRLTLGLLAFIAANVPVFIGAAQIFGDPFVLMILGTQLGFVLAVPRIIALEKSRNRASEPPRSGDENLHGGRLAWQQAPISQV